MYLVDTIHTHVFLQACYIFIIEKIQEAFIYIRDHNNEKQVEKCLKFGELYAEDSNYLVNSHYTD